MRFDSVTRKPTLPCCCVECAQAYTRSQSLQQPEIYLSHNDSLEIFETELGNNVKDLPPIPTQGISSSNRDLTRLRYPQKTQDSYSPAKPQDRVEPPLIPSVRTEEPIQSQQPLETHSGFSSSTNKPRDRVESPTTAPAKDQGQDRSADASKRDTRPHLMHGTPSQMDTQYVNMLLAIDDIPKLHNLYAGFFNWILLAGFILFPGTFTSLKNLNLSGQNASAQVEERLVNAVTNIPLFVIGWLCTGVGAAGMGWLWWRWRNNYVWILNKIFTPGAMNSLAGFLSTIVNVFGAQHGEFSSTSKTTIVVTAGSTLVLGTLTAVYSLWMVKRVKSQHDQEVGKQRTGKYGEGVVDLSTRQVQV